jgi:outer membrane protein assembly factor BamB
MKCLTGFVVATISVATFFSTNANAKDQPQWGTAWTRNMVSGEKNIPAKFDPKTRENIKWVAKLGSETHSTPVIANGRVYIGTNNNDPRDPKHQGDRGVLMCFSEKEGKLLWQLVVPKREEDPYHDWPNSGISSSATVEGNRVYIVDNRGVVVCLDVHGLSNGNDGSFTNEAARMTRPGQPQLTPGPLDADVLWEFDLTKEAGIWSHDGAHTAILIRGDHLYLNTGTGVDNTHRKIRTPDAPSLVVLDKKTGRYLARDMEGIAPNIFHCTWSAPSMGKVAGKDQIFFAGGNGVVYGFEPLGSTARPSTGVKTLRSLWSFKFDPSGPDKEVHRFTSNRKEGPSNIYGMPVLDGNNLYVAGGGDYWWGKNEAWLKCLDLAAVMDGKEEIVRWSFPLNKHVMSTAAIVGDLLFIADTGRFVYCLDKRTGKQHWSHELKGDIWSSPYVVDGKVFIGTRRGDFWVFAAKPAKELLHQVELESPISATAIAANGTLYIATMKELIAVGK